MAEYLVNSEDLTVVADAIRAKGGTDAQLTFPGGFASAIQALAAGGAGIIVRNVITAAESMTIYEVLNAVELKAAYKNSLLLLGCYDDVTPDRGSYTIGNYTIWHAGRTIQAASDTYQAGMVSFETFKTKTYNEPVGGLAIDSVGRIQQTTVGSESCCVAAGGTFKCIEIPLSLETFSVDPTAWEVT